jgi:hypothetical protein
MIPGEDNGRPLFGFTPQDEVASWLNGIHLHPSLTAAYDTTMAWKFGKIFGLVLELHVTG